MRFTGKDGARGFCEAPQEQADVNDLAASPTDIGRLEMESQVLD